VNGIINLLKPPGLSSARAVSSLKRMTGEKLGHAGTLDPEACGVLPIMMGKATKLFDYLTLGEKVYVTEITFGAATDTQDATGQVTQAGENYPDEAALRVKLAAFEGRVMQRPPSYSAIKKNGVPLYALARKGEIVITQARPVMIHGISILGETPHHGFLLRIRCGKGTYIRTLCHDLGQALGCPAHMRLLIREQTGMFRIEDAITLEELETSLEAGQTSGPWLKGALNCLSHLRQVLAPDASWKNCVNGLALEVRDLSGSQGMQEDELAVLTCRDLLIGVYQHNAGHLQVKTMLFDVGGDVLCGAPFLDSKSNSR
jgi:tRNA pseudouridine55 synthase